MKEKIAKACNTIFGYGMLIALLVAFVLFLSFILSIFIGEEAAGTITTFLYKTVMPINYIYAVCVSLIGLIGMYLRGEKAMLMSAQKKKK